MTKPTTDRPDYQSTDYGALAARWTRVDYVLGGTYTMREAGEEILPQFPAEADDVYALRLQSATSDGDYPDTLDGLVGMVFHKPVTPGENVPAQIRTNLEDVDLRGTHFNVFNQRLFRKGVHYGAAYVLVDMQRKPAEFDGPIDQATADALNLRPYWTLYGMNHVQDFPRYVIIRGAKTLQQIVFRECQNVPDGNYASREVVRYRVWRLPVAMLPDGQFTEAGFVQWELWEEQESETGRGGVEPDTELVMIAEGDTPLKRIPVAPFIAHPDVDDPHVCAGPTLEDLSELCIKDFDKQSDFEKSLHYCQPVPYTVGLKEDGVLTERPWGSGVQFDLEIGGAMGYAEPSGNAFPTWEKYLATLKEKIKQKGLEMVMEGGSVNTTATEQVLRAKKRASRLAQLSEAVRDCIEAALGFSAAWLRLGDDAGGEVTMGMSADELTLTAQDFTALNASVVAGNLSRLTFLELLGIAGMLPDAVTPEIEVRRLAEQRASEPAPVQLMIGAGTRNGATAA